jgi:hypothetical protein
MRRRALLAASAASGGGGGNESFYAEFFFDYCEDNIFYICCYRAPDSLGQQCYENAQELTEKYGINDGSATFLTNPIDYGFEVYIEGELCTGIYIYNVGELFLITDGAYAYTQILHNGKIQYEG